MSKALQLFRALIPSWRFFEDYGEKPLLFFRVCPPQGVFGPWLPCPTPLKRSFRSLFLNPDGNSALACKSLLAELIAVLEDVDESNAGAVENLVPYQLVKRLVQIEAANAGQIKPGSRYQFRVSTVTLETGEHALEDVLISREDGI